MKNMVQTILATRQITKRYGSVVAVDQVSLTLQQGQIYGLVGQNGAGKTTLMRIMTGQTIPTSGELEIVWPVIIRCLKKLRRRASTACVQT